MNDGAIEKEATCTEAGVKVYTCTVCGDTKKEEIPATGHVWDEGKVTTEATTEAEGVKTYTCTICGDTKTKRFRNLMIMITKVIPMTTTTVKPM